ncbi:MAG: MCE family protein, partial [Planctomycetes bacterium]|nr:MCE family protein [Planctomycetota bacterium]
MNDQAIRFRFGIFVLAALILLAVLVILFGGFPNYFKRTETFNISFENAQGVAAGTPVRRSGVRIGEVRSVTLDNETGKVIVQITVDEKYYLRKGDRPTLLQSLLGGEATIAFIPPDDKARDDPTPVAPGSTLQGFNPSDVGTLMQRTGDLIAPAQEAVVEIKKVFQSIGKMTPVVEDTLKDFREIGRMAKNVGPEIQKTAEEIRILSKTTREIIPDLKKTGHEIQVAAKSWGEVGKRADDFLKKNEDKIAKSLDRLEEALKRVNSTLSDENQKLVQDTLKNLKNGTEKFDGIAKDAGELIKETRVSLKRADEAIADLQKAMKPFGEKGPAILKNIDEATESLNKSLKDLREIISVVARNDGTVQRLLSDPSLYNNLNDS